MDSTSYKKGPKLRKEVTGDLKRADKEKVGTLAGDFSRARQESARHLKVDKGGTPSFSQMAKDMLHSIGKGGAQYDVWGVPINTTKRPKSR
jgi:hypothetical protein